MAVKTFFLKDIRIPSFRQSLSLQDQSILDKYLEEMEVGPGDGNMDLEWRDTGKGYYLHEHILGEIENESERNQFLLDLQEDIDTWLTDEPNNYMVTQVRDNLLTGSNKLSIE